VLATPSAALTVAVTLATTEEVEMVEIVETETSEETRTKETETSEETLTKETEMGIASTINPPTTLAMAIATATEMVAMEGPTIFPPATVVDVVDLDVVEVAAATVDPQVAAVAAAAEETKEVENLQLSNGSQGLLILGEGGGVLQTTKPLLPAI